MNLRAGNECLRSGIKAMVAGMLLFLLVFAGLAAGHSGVHEWLHTDQSATGHFCFVTLLQHGLGDTAPTVVTITAPPLTPGILVASADSQICSQNPDVPEARGPPALS